MMQLLVEKPGMFTTVQDLGRRGYQMQGVPVAGAMDASALRLGNILVGNPEEFAGLEITMIGPTLNVADGEGCFAVTGAEVGITKNGSPVSCWTTHKIVAGDTLAFAPPKKGGFRAYFCVSGGIDVPLVMGSRSTYTRGKFGGNEGRAVKAGDSLSTGTPDPLWANYEGLSCPPSLRPERNLDAPLRVLAGPQEDLFSEEGLATFYASEYSITNSADRMGYRMEGPVIQHKKAPDIISDAICLGSVQVPGHGQPIVMLADRQTTGGYTKIATVCTVDSENLAQRLPGQKVRFKKISLDEAVALLQQEESLFDEMKRLRVAWRLRLTSPVTEVSDNSVTRQGVLQIRIDGQPFHVEWEQLD